MTLSSYTPPWSTFQVLKHPPEHAHLSAVYCLAAAARWFHRFDDKVPSLQAILKAMLAVPLPRRGVTEKHLRRAADLYGIEIFRNGQKAGWDDIVDPTMPPGSVTIASVVGLPVPGMREPPEDYRFVLILGVPDKRRRFLIGDPHPDTPNRYRVPVDEFRVAWEASGTKTANPKALVVWRPESRPRAGKLIRLAGGYRRENVNEETRKA